MLYFIRHGQTDWNVAHKIQGETDVPLNDCGRKQAYDSLQNIIPLNINKIISSDLKRAKETAQIIQQCLNVPMTIDSRLNEISCGILEGKTRQEISESLFSQYRLQPEQFGAESYQHIFYRIKSFFSSIDTKEQNILIVTHTGTLRMITYYMSNKDKFDINTYLNSCPPINIGNAQLMTINSKTR